MMDNITIVKQVMDSESTETNINIDYQDKIIRIYSSKATVINRILRKWYKPYKIDKLHGEICSMTFNVPTNEITKFLRGDIFRYDQN